MYASCIRIVLRLHFEYVQAVKLFPHKFKDVRQLLGWMHDFSRGVAVFLIQPRDGQTGFPTRHKNLLFGSAQSSSEGEMQLLFPEFLRYPPNIHADNKGLQRSLRPIQSGRIQNLSAYLDVDLINPRFVHMSTPERHRVNWVFIQSESSGGTQL